MSQYGDFRNIELAVTLSLSKPTEASIGYQLQIKAPSALDDINAIKYIINKRKLALKEENESIVIYDTKSLNVLGVYF